MGLFNTESAQSDIFIYWHNKTNYYIFTGIPLSKIPKKWAPYEPDNKGNQENCLTMNSNGELADLSCVEIRPYVCYRSAESKQKINECGTVDSGKCSNSSKGGSGARGREVILFLTPQSPGEIP